MDIALTTSFLTLTASRLGQAHVFKLYPTGALGQSLRYKTLTQKLAVMQTMRVFVLTTAQLLFALPVKFLELTLELLLLKEKGQDSFHQLVVTQSLKIQRYVLTSQRLKVYQL
jgi:hypothetical protein